MYFAGTNKMYIVIAHSYKICCVVKELLNVSEECTSMDKQQETLSTCSNLIGLLSLKILACCSVVTSVSINFIAIRLQIKKNLQTTK